MFSNGTFHGITHRKLKLAAAAAAALKFGVLAKKRKVAGKKKEFSKKKKTVFVVYECACALHKMHVDNS
jgi:hypothetical protein